LKEALNALVLKVSTKSDLKGLLEYQEKTLVHLIQPYFGHEVRTTKETKNSTTTWKQHGWLPFPFVSRINGCMEDYK
jgi:hypothetical protein